LTVLGAVFPHFCRDKREIWYGGADRPSFQILRLSGNVSPLRDEKPIFGPLSKTIPVWLRRLPVTRNQYASPQRGYATPAAMQLERF